MRYAPEGIAADYLEISSEQRLSIIMKLYSEKTKLSVMAKEVNSTASEVFRNFERLQKAEIIEKDSNGYYYLTTFGKLIYWQIPSFAFVTQNKKYFRAHDFGDISQKFIQRVGALLEGEHIKGFTKVLEKWHQITSNANEYIYDILVEEPLELFDPIVKKAKDGIKVKSIFSESAIIPLMRKKKISDLGASRLIESGQIERKMKKDIKVVVILNEKEACVMFPIKEGEADIKEMFYSDKPEFHEWCLDYFRDYWDNSDLFQERKLKE